MTNINVRPCTEQDGERICLINSSAFGYDFPEDETKQRVKEILNRKTDKILCAVDEDNVIGYVHGADYECTYSKPLKNIMAIAVLKEYQGRGVGKMLLSAIEEWSKQTGCDGVRLVSGENRAEAHKFYEHCGYKTRKLQKNFIKIF